MDNQKEHISKSFYFNFLYFVLFAMLLSFTFRLTYSVSDYLPFHNQFSEYSLDSVDMKNDSSYLFKKIIDLVSYISDEKKNIHLNLFVFHFTLILILSILIFQETKSKLASLLFLYLFILNREVFFYLSFESSVILNSFLLVLSFYSLLRDKFKSLIFCVLLLSFSSLISIAIAPASIFIGLYKYFNKFPFRSFLPWYLVTLVFSFLSLFIYHPQIQFELYSFIYLFKRTVLELPLLVFVALFFIYLFYKKVLKLNLYAITVFFVFLFSVFLPIENSGHLVPFLLLIVFSLCLHLNFLGFTDKLNIPFFIMLLIKIMVFDTNPKLNFKKNFLAPDDLFTIRTLLIDLNQHMSEIDDNFYIHHKIKNYCYFFLSKGTELECHKMIGKTHYEMNQLIRDNKNYSHYAFLLNSFEDKKEYLEEDFVYNFLMKDHEYRNDFFHGDFKIISFQR